MPTTLRIAFVIHQHSVFSDGLLRGMSRASLAIPELANRQYILREFLLPEESTEPPPTLLTWQPDALICLLAPEYTPLLEATKRGGRPIIHNANVTSRPGEAVVVHNAMDFFAAAHRHFKQVGTDRVVLIGSRDGSWPRIEARYRSYCEQQGLACEAYCIEGGCRDMNKPGPVQRWPIELEAWLKSLPKRTGLFTNNLNIGPFVARLCEHLGIAVPDDLAIIGSDGFDVSAWSRPALTSIHYPIEKIGTESIRVAIRMLHGWKAPAEHIRLDGCTVVPRGSTARDTREGLDIPGALDFIEQHTFDDITMQDVVEITQRVSRQTFAKHFKTWTGMTPAQAIRKRKLDEAKRMLRETEVSITALSRACGFCDDIAFRKVFGKAEGCSPSDYRKRHLPH